MHLEAFFEGLHNLKECCKIIPFDNCVTKNKKREGDFLSDFFVPDTW